MEEVISGSKAMALYDRKGNWVNFLFLIYIQNNIA